MAHPGISCHGRAGHCVVLLLPEPCAGLLSRQGQLGHGVLHVEVETSGVCGPLRMDGLLVASTHGLARDLYFGTAHPCHGGRPGLCTALFLVELVSDEIWGLGARGPSIDLSLLGDVEAD